MSGEKKTPRSAAGTVLGALERAALFSLQVVIGLVDLTIALFVAVHLGVIPPKKVEQFKAYVANAPVVGRLFKKEAPEKPAPKPKLKKPSKPAID